MSFLGQLVKLVPQREGEPDFGPRCSWRSRVKASLDSAGARPHPVTTGEVSLDVIKLLDASRLGELPMPLPRQQDLALDLFGVPTAADVLVAVSHGWRNQAHPDPCGNKQALLRDILAGLQSDLNQSCVGASIFIFLDFLSVPQRPFRPEQPARAPEEVRNFKAALACMHYMYFVSDHIIHLPWDGQRLPEEGRPYTAPAETLKRASFAQAGSHVQVLQPNKDARDSRVHMFDLVEQVDGQPITSVRQLEELLDRETAVAVKMRRYPFGLANDIDTDLRGWIFLERFITMVKCAMMDEQSAQRVVITPSEAIREQITEGAKLLRAAAKKGPRALERELGRFNSELQLKHFSPASLDKTEMQMQRSSPKDKDREQVCQIMQGFVDHLATRWEEEAVRQRGLSRKLIAATQNFFTEWDCFSRPYAAKLEEASQRRPWPEGVLLMLPLAIPAIAFSVPLSPPLPPWWQHRGFYFLVIPTCATPAAVAVCLLVVRTSGVRCHAQTYRKLVVRAQVLAPMVGLTYICLSLASGHFPVPQGPVLILPIVLPPMLVITWFLFSREQRAAQDYQRRLGGAILGFLSFVGIVIVPLTLFTEMMGQVEVGWQVLISAGFFLDKLAFEAVATKLSRFMGADAMVVFLFNGLTHYHLFVCLGISKSSSWLVVAEQFVLDLAENIYYLWSLERTKSSKNAAQQQYILAILALREMLEVLCPIWFLCALLVTLLLHPELSALTCPLEKVQRVLQFLCSHLALEGLGSLLTWLWLLRQHRNPVRLLHALVATEWAAFSVFVAGNFGYYLFQQHSHAGLDPSFTFAWTRSNASWVCGTTWE